MPPQTKRQREVLDLITRHIEANGYRPSYQGIAKSLKLRSRSGIARIVKDLEAQGLLERQRENGHFAIKINEHGGTVSVNWLTVPGSDDLVASKPLTLPAFVIGTYEPADMRVMFISDSSMAPEIDIDDIVLVELRDYCRNGQPIVALVDGDKLLLRRYFRPGSEIELHAADPAVKPISRAANEVKIIGIYRGLVRPAV
ncbi:MAG: S24 family peptidase [Pyrinomonadaceae bacterium]